MHQAAIPRERTILWNVIPWWNGRRAVRGPELENGVSRISELIDLLPRLRVIILVGEKAAVARSHLETTGLALFTSVHPSPLVRARWPEKWKAIPSEWRKVKSFIV